MTKTTWLIIDNTENAKTELTYYHFGKAPQFPTWYFEDGHNYEVEMIWSFKLINTFKLFFKCLFHQYVIK